MKTTTIAEVRDENGLLFKLYKKGRWICLSSITPAYEFGAGESNTKTVHPDDLQKIIRDLSDYDGFSIEDKYAHLLF
jgi:hypothetical protein